MSTTFVKGPLQMMGSSFFFALMAYFAKLASVRIPGAEIAFIRFAVGVAAALILAGLGMVDLKASNKRLLFMRGTFGGLSVLFYFSALAGGSMTNSTILNNTYPIFATLVAVFTVNERISVATGISLLVAWIGVVFLVHPDIYHLYWPDLMGLLSGILGGVAIAMVRELRQKNESSWNVFFYLSLFGCMFSLIIAIPVWVWPDFQNWLLVLVAGLFALTGQLMLTSAYKYCSTAVGGILSMTTVIFSSVIGIFILGERPTLGENIGAFLIIFGSILVVWSTSLPKIRCKPYE